MVEVYDIQLDQTRPPTGTEILAMHNIMLAYADVLVLVMKNDPPLPQEFLKAFWSRHDRLAFTNKMLFIDAKAGEPDAQA